MYWRTTNIFSGMWLKTIKNINSYQEVRREGLWLLANGCRCIGGQLRPRATTTHAFEHGSRAEVPVVQTGPEQSTPCTTPTTTTSTTSTRSSALSTTTSRGSCSWALRSKEEEHVRASAHISASSSDAGETFERPRTSSASGTDRHLIGHYFRLNVWQLNRQTNQNKSEQIRANLENRGAIRSFKSNHTERAINVVI